MGQLANGETSVEVTGQSRGDEIKKIAVAVKVFKEGLIREFEPAEAQRLETSAKEERANTIERLVREFDSAIGVPKRLKGRINRTSLTSGAGVFRANPYTPPA